jgi:hypothetical protein
MLIFLLRKLLCRGGIQSSHEPYPMGPIPTLRVYYLYYSSASDPDNLFFDPPTYFVYGLCKLVGSQSPSKKGSKPSHFLEKWGY